MYYKKCRACKKNLSIDNYYPHKQCKDWYRWTCKKCHIKKVKFYNLRKKLNVLIEVEAPEIRNLHWKLALLGLIWLLSLGVVIGYILIG